MEFLIGAIVIIVLLLILGVPWITIVEGIIILMLILLFAMFVFFIVTLVLLLMSRPKRGIFKRIIKHEVVGTYAIYEIDGEEYKNTFPAEIMFVDRIYKEGKTYSARLHKGKKSYMLFDWYSYIVIGVGLPVSLALAVGLGWFLLSMWMM